MSQAVLAGAQNNAHLQLWVECNEKKALIARLNNGNETQMRLDLAFGVDDNVAFAVKGEANAEVHLSGYYLSEIDDNIDSGDCDSKKRLKLSESVCYELFYIFLKGQ